MKRIQFVVAVILYNPDIAVLKQMKIYADCFEKMYVIDNSVTKNYDVVNALKTFKNIDYIDMKGNQGISEALNIAFKLAIKEEFDYILTMDQDTDFASNDIKKMQECISYNMRDDIAVYTPNFRKKYYNDKGVVYSSTKYPVEKIDEVDSCMTSGSFVSCKVVRDILPLENYFIAHVDTELAAKIKVRGYKILLIGSVIFDQQLGRPIKATWFNMNFNATNHEPLRYYYMVRNYLHIRKKYKKETDIRKQLRLIPFKYLFKMMTSETNKIKKIRFAYKGYKDYKKGVFGEYPG